MTESLAELHTSVGPDPRQSVMRSESAQKGDVPRGPCHKSPDVKLPEMLRRKALATAMFRSRSGSIDSAANIGATLVGGGGVSAVRAAVRTTLATPNGLGCTIAHPGEAEALVFAAGVDEGFSSCLGLRPGSRSRACPRAARGKGWGGAGSAAAAGAAGDTQRAVDVRVRVKPRQRCCFWRRSRVPTECNPLNM